MFLEIKIKNSEGVSEHRSLIPLASIAAVSEKGDECVLRLEHAGESTHVIIFETYDEFKRRIADCLQVRYPYNMKHLQKALNLERL